MNRSLAECSRSRPPAQHLSIGYGRRSEGADSDSGPGDGDGVMTVAQRAARPLRHVPKCIPGLRYGIIDNG
jgi:hypothetical protein